jgi:hypothetical protein
MKPYDLYVRFLVTKGVPGHQEVNDLLKEVSLKPISEDEFEKQYHIVHDNITKPISDQIANQKFEGAFLKYMGLLQVRELWQIEKPFLTPETAKHRLVYDIHHDPIMRLTINALIMKNMAVPDIVQDINMKFSYMLRDEHVMIYKKFFWNPEIMTRASWKSYLPLCDGQEKATLFTALTEDLDTVKNFLELPSRVDVSGSLQNLLVQSYHKAKHYLKLNTVEGNREARAWVGTVLAVAEKHQKYSRADVGDFAKSIQMEFDYVTADFDTPDNELLKELQAKNMPKGDDEQK